MNQKQNFLKGITVENPILYSMLGLCPTLAITTKVENALGMGIAVLFVLIMSNMLISAIRKIVPSEIRIPVYIVIIATFVTIVDMVMAAFLPDLHASLGIFIPLIVVNCIILGRAEAFASDNNVYSSIVDAVGMAIGYTLILALISFIREFLGTGVVTIWGSLALDVNKLFGDEKLPFFTTFFTSPAGAYIVLGIIFGAFAAIRNRDAAKKKEGKSK